PPPCPSNPLTLLNCARMICATFVVFPLLKTAEIVPSGWIDRLFNEPAAEPSWVLAVTPLGFPNALTLGVPRSEISFHVMPGLMVAPLSMEGRVTPVGGILKLARAGGVPGSAPTHEQVS